MQYQSTLSGDIPCCECGTANNLVWSTESPLWNAVVRVDLSRWGDVDPVLCLPCFVGFVEASGLRPTGWHVSPQWPWATA